MRKKRRKSSEKLNSGPEHFARKRKLLSKNTPNSTEIKKLSKSRLAFRKKSPKSSRTKMLLLLQNHFSRLI